MHGVSYMLSYRYIICTQRGASRCNQECHLLAQVWVVLRPERNKNFDRELRYQNYHGHIPVAYRLYTKGQMRQTDYSDGIRWGKTFLSRNLYESQVVSTPLKWKIVFQVARHTGNLILLVFSLLLSTCVFWSFQLWIFESEAALSLISTWMGDHMTGVFKSQHRNLP